MIPLVILGLFVLTTVMLFYRIQIGFAVLIVLYMVVLPSVKVTVGPIDVFLYNSWILVAWIAFAINIFLKKIKRPLFTKLYLKPNVILLLGLFILIFFSTKLDIPYHINFFIFNTFFSFSLCFIGWFIYNDIKYIDIFEKLIAIVSLIVTIYGIYCYVTVSNPYIQALDVLFPSNRDTLARMEEARGGLTGRVQGTMSHAITWGGSCFILFFFFLRKNTKLNPLFKSILLTLLALNVFLSGSRSALLSLIMGAIVFFMFSNLKLKIKLLKYAVISSVVVISAIYQVPALNKYTGIFESTVFFWDDSTASKNDVGGSSLSMRMDQLKGAFDMIPGSTIFAGLGHGYSGYYQTTFGQHPILRGFESILFFALVNSGIIGLVLWLYLFYGLYMIVKRISVKLKIRNSFDVSLSKGYVLSYFLFILFTGFMSTQLLFFVLFVIQIKGLILEETSKLTIPSDQQSVVTNDGEFY